MVKFYSTKKNGEDKYVKPYLAKFTEKIRFTTLLLNIVWNGLLWGCLVSDCSLPPPFQKYVMCVSKSFAGLYFS